MAQHKWIKTLVDRSLVYPNGNPVEHEWRCAICLSVALTPLKPKSKKDYSSLDLGRDCEEELIRRVHAM